MEPPKEHKIPQRITFRYNTQRYNSEWWCGSDMFHLRTDPIETRKFIDSEAISRFIQQCQKNDTK